MVKFKLNKQLDKDMASQFLGYVFAGVDFGRNVCEYHPELKDVNGTNIKVIGEHFDNFYKINRNRLKEKAEIFQSQWDKVEKSFISNTEKLFNGYKFPNGKYIGYVSSFNCNPRFLEDKTFQLFYKSDSSIETTSHEMMHFIFYAYTSEKFSRITKDLDNSNGLWWNAAEIFNNVVLSSKKFTEILKTNGDDSYPDHQKYIPRAKKLYSETKSIDDFISKLFNLLN